jgi:Flp pilus assembly protein TadG
MRLPRIFGRFARDNRGAAVVEFALILPFLLLLYLGTLEASSLITVDRRINIISGTVGDLVARWDPEAGTMPAGTMTDYFRASEGIITPYEASPLLQVVSVIEVEADGDTVVRWSRAYNGATARAVDSAYDTIPDNLKAVATPGFVVVSEASYNYTPVLGLIFADEFNLYSESFYLPRFGVYVNPPA